MKVTIREDDMVLERKNTGKKNLTEVRQPKTGKDQIQEDKKKKKK